MAKRKRGRAILPIAAPSSAAPDGARAADMLRALRVGELPAMIPTSLVAELLGVSRHTVWKLATEGELAGVRITRRCLRIERESLAAYVRKNVL